ncbi:MAG: DNA-binding response regulator [Rhodospirillaceae bacterium]|jgi:DNA-binding response OmpR family regulator|nr:DNA-binding response regulator [Rhodospirillaceae bacterium]
MSLRILVAEDDAPLRQALTHLFRAEGYECLPAADGAEALHLFRTQKPDFCVIDVMMPGMDGFDLCRAIRSEDVRVPVIVLTARHDEIDRVVGLELGADDYVTKPFGSRELVARVKAILRRSMTAAAQPDLGETSGAARFAIGDIEIDVKALRGFRGSDPIDLTRREVAILATLHRRTGEVVSRDELYDSCWGRDYMPNSRAIDQSIRTLRLKIERDPARPAIIRTVHGAGYRYDGV